MSSSAARSQFLAGLKAELPILLGVVPFGLIYGVLAIDAGLSAAQAQAMSLIVFAGSAQFVMAQLFALGTPASIIVLTAILVNLRHALYSVSIAPYVKQLPGRWRLGLAYLLTDEAYAVSISHYQRGGDAPDKQWYFLGAGLALWTTWQLSTAAGVLLGAQIPGSWPLDFFLPLTFIALVVPALEDRAALASALVAGLVSVLAFGLPFKLGLIFAALVGVAAGLLFEKAAGSQPANADDDRVVVDEAPPSFNLEPADRESDDPA